MLNLEMVHCNIFIQLHADHDVIQIEKHKWHFDEEKTLVNIVSLANILPIQS